MRIAVVGAGWSGLAAAVAATTAGHAVTVFEASRGLGGRARGLAVTVPEGGSVRVDNGQHILVGAYGETLRLMRRVGVAPEAALLRLPLALRFADGGGLALPAWPAPLNAAAGIAGARGWSVRDKWSLLRAALQWRRAGFECAAPVSVSELAASLTPRVVAELIEPLCVSALNTPAPHASAAVFLRILRDTLFTPGGSDLLLPRRDLGSLFPEPAARWLQAHGGAIRHGARVQAIAPAAGGWLVDGERFERVILACPAGEAGRLVEGSGAAAAGWVAQARGLRHEAIATVYAGGGPRLPRPMLALRSGPQAPAQFVFDRSHLGGPPGLLAFVVSACPPAHEDVAAQVLAQARGLGWRGLRPLRTVVEKRATFACTPGLQRPGTLVASGLHACGDYVAGPYPATLEGAVRSALQAVAAVT